MNNKKSILLYNLYPMHTWKEVTYSMFQYVPHDEIAVHISLPLIKLPFLPLHRQDIFIGFRPNFLVNVY